MRHEGSVEGAAFSPDDTHVATWSNDDANAKIWNVETGELVATLRHSGGVWGVRFLRDGVRVLSWAAHDGARIWDGRSGAAVSPVMNLGGGLLRGPLLFATDTRILTWGRDGAAVLDAATGARIRTFETGGWVEGALLTADERLAMTWGPQGRGSLWDVGTGRLIARLDARIENAQFTADESRILTSGSGAARMWYAATGRQTGPTLRHDDNGAVDGAFVDGAMFSPDETRILTWSSDRTARLWDSAIGAQIGPVMLHRSVVDHAMFSPDGARILTTSSDGAGRVWSVAELDRLAALKSSADAEWRCNPDDPVAPREAWRPLDRPRRD